MRTRWWAALLAVVLGGGLTTPELEAQGVTTAAMAGRVTNQEREPLAGVAVTVTNEATGVSKSATTNSQGRYLVPGLQIGGPYRVSTSAIGYADDSRGNITLKLGEQFVADFQLAVQAVQLGGIEVTAARAAAIINPNRTGAEQLVTEHQIQNLPTIGRNFTDAIALSPLTGTGGGAAAIGQQNNRFNNIQIDGALAQDLFGLGSTGQPGGQAGARSITMAAVKEYQVLVAPYDVRQSGFTGGLVNAVTKSGTNEWHGSFSAFMRQNDDVFIRQTLVAQGDTFPASEFENRIYGATLGGPIIRDRAHFFVAGEWEDATFPGGDIAVGREAVSVTGIAEADAERFTSLLAARGVEPGSFGESEAENPNRNLFGRIDAQLSNDHIITLRHNYVRAEDDVIPNRTIGTRYSLSSNFYAFESTTNSSVAQLNSTFGENYYNELTLSWTRIRDRRSPLQRFPEIRVSVPNAAGTGTKELRAGAEEFSQGNELDQDSWEITNNLSFTLGKHRVTVGVHDEIFKFRNLFQPRKTGVWTFSSLDALETGTPNQFTRDVPAQEGIDPNARFTVSQLSAYAQTEWSAAPNLRFTAGLRYDVPIVHDDPGYNPAIETAFGRRTDEVASGNGILSPRLGFNWDVNGEGVTQVRGGGGIFAGRFPFVWLSNIYSNTGIFTVSLRCTGAAIPDFTVDPDNQPDACRATANPEPPTSVINLMDPEFEYPHAWRFNVGVDHQLPWGIVGTVDAVYSKSIKQIFLRELNLDLDPVSETQGGRPVFGTHRTGTVSGNNNSIASPNRISTEALSVVELTNSDDDNSYSITLQAQKRYSSGVDLNASYSYARAEDVTGLTSSIATSNIGFNPVPGSPNSPPLATSNYEQRHKLVLAGSWDVRSWLTWSVLYLGNSGDRYTFVYDGDVNADGFEAFYANNRFNDLLYVPENQADISLVDPTDWSAINSYIEGVPCLHENRGRILERNACEGKWRNRVDTRFTFRAPTFSGQRVELLLDFFNVLNLLNDEWGLNQGVQFPIDLLELRGWDAANNRGIFRPTGSLRLDQNNEPIVFRTFDPSSRWQAQIGIRYAF